MPSSITSTYNSYKKIQSRSLNGRIVLQPHTWYTCPSGKRAIVKGVAACTSTGASATSSLEGAGEIIRKVYHTGGESNPWMKKIKPEVIFNFEIELEENETLKTIQASGTNAAWDVIAQITETPM